MPRKPTTKTVTFADGSKSVFNKDGNGEGTLYVQESKNAGRASYADSGLVAIRGCADDPCRVVSLSAKYVSGFVIAAGRVRGPRAVNFLIGYLRMFTARAMTRPTVISDTADWIIIIILAQWENGKVSVGLNAVALVNER